VPNDGWTTNASGKTLELCNACRGLKSGPGGGRLVVTGFGNMKVEGTRVWEGESTSRSSQSGILGIEHEEVRGWSGHNLLGHPYE